MAAFDCFAVLAFLPTFGPMELLIVGGIAVLLFGNRLPSVMRSLGQSVMEFRKGIGSIESELRSATSERPWSPPAHTSSGSSYGNSYDNVDDYEEPSAPKFEPPPADGDASSSEKGSVESPASDDSATADQT